jgi:hypothetical protein
VGNCPSTAFITVSYAGGGDVGVGLDPLEKSTGLKKFDTLEKSTGLDTLKKPRLPSAG